MKKIIYFLLCLVMLSGCGTNVTFEEWVNEIPEGQDNIIKIDEILGYIEMKDAKIGLSLFLTDKDDTILYLSQIYLDKKGPILRSNHGVDDPLIFYEEGNQRIWSMYDDEAFLYSEGETGNYNYACGIINGKIENIEYDQAKVEKKTMNFKYQSQDIVLTLWVVELNKFIQFDYSKLKY